MKHVCMVSFFIIVVVMPMGYERVAIATVVAMLAGFLHAFNSLFRRYECSHADEHFLNPLGAKF